MNSRSIVVIVLLILTLSGNAQPPGNPGGDPDVPITGIEFLVAGGALLGIKRWLGKKNRK